MGAVPLQVPFVAVSVCPTWGVPLICGGFWLVGLTVIAAVPVRNEPKIAPMARAASARPRAVTCAARAFHVCCLLLSWSVCALNLVPRREEPVRGLSGVVRALHGNSGLVQRARRAELAWMALILERVGR